VTLSNIQRFTKLNSTEERERERVKYTNNFSAINNINAKSQAEQQNPKIKGYVLQTKWVSISKTMPLDTVFVLFYIKNLN